MKSILIIGAGRVGSSLYRAIKEEDNYLVYLYDIELPAEVDTKWFDSNDFINSLTGETLEKVNTIFVCTQDDQIKTVVDHLQQFNLQAKSIIHTAGSYDSNILNPLSAMGAKTGSMHPMQTFDQRFLKKEIWRDILCSFEGSDEIVEEMESLCQILGAKFIRITSEQKMALHIAGVISANFQVGLIKWAEQILKNSQLDGIDYSKILIPLMQKTIDNYKEKDVTKILTGPLARGDVRTMRNHLIYLNSHCDNSEIELYKKMAAKITNDPNFEIKCREELIKILEEQ